MIPLVDVNSKNGATEVVPATHQMNQTPSESWLEKNKVVLNAKAGEIFVMDSSLMHKAGINSTSTPRTMMILRYQLAFIKTPIDLCRVYQEELKGSTNLIKTRMGMNCRSMSDLTEIFCPVENKKWKSGQYKIENAKITPSAKRNSSPS